MVAGHRISTERARDEVGSHLIVTERARDEVDGWLVVGRLLLVLRPACAAANELLAAAGQREQLAVHACEKSRESPHVLSTIAN